MEEKREMEKNRNERESERGTEEHMGQSMLGRETRLPKPPRTSCFVPLLSMISPWIGPFLKN